MLSKKKQNNSLMLLIFSVMMSWNSFSQSVTDSTQIQLTKPVAKLVIKDLIQFDGLSQEMETMQIILTETNNKLNTQGELVSNLKVQVLNYQSIIEKKNQQFSTQKELSKRLQQDLKKQKIRTKLMGGAGIAIAGSYLVISDANNETFTGTSKGLLLTGVGSGLSLVGFILTWGAGDKINYDNDIAKHNKRKRKNK